VLKPQSVSGQALAPEDLEEIGDQRPVECPEGLNARGGLFGGALTVAPFTGAARLAARLGRCPNGLEGLGTLSAYQDMDEWH
jgi:hypothetical protein